MPENQDTFQKYMNQGHSAAWDQKWEQAAGYYRQALETMPDQPTALNSLGLALFALLDYDSALQCYWKASKLSPEDPVPVDKISIIFELQNKIPEATTYALKCADLYLKNKDIERAIENWNRVLSYTPDNLNVRTRLAMIYEKLGRKKESVHEFLACASIMQQAGDITKAFQVTQYALQVMPDYPDALTALNYLKTNQPLPRPDRPKPQIPSGAKADIKQIEAPHEEDSGLAPVAEARQKAMVELASMLFDAPDDTIPNNGQVSRRGVSSLTRGTGGLSLENAERKRILMHLSQAIDSQTQGNDAQAAEELDRAIEIGLNRSAAYFNLGFLLATKSQQKALRFLQISVKNPDYALGSYLLIGEIEQDSAHLNEAAGAYLHAMALADAQSVPPDQADALRQLYEPVIESESHQADEEALKKLCASIAAQLHRPDWRSYLKQARKQLPAQSPNSPPLPLAEMLLDSHSGQVVDALSMVQRLVNENKLRSAMEEAFHALQYAPTFMPLHVQMAELLVKEGHILEAIEKFLLIANLYNLRGDTSQAVSLLMRVTDMVPMDLSVRGKLIEMLIAQGRIEETIQQYINLAEIYYQLAELDMARQTYQSALKLAQEARVHRKWLIQILTKLGDIDMQRLDIRQAVRVYEQLRTLQPEDGVARAMLMNLNFRMGNDPAALMELDNYMALLENSGKRVQAVKFIKDYLVEYGDRWEIRKRLADIYAHQGKLEDAVKMLDALADELMEKDNKTGAMAMVEAIISLNPPNVADYYNALNALRSSLA
jgi:tetratricopeptide (TPR) repeat protein